MTSIAYELIAMALAERIGREATRIMSNAAILCRAQAFMVDRIGRSGLDMEDVAVAVGVSVRRLYRIAAEEGVSLVDWMWSRRLELAKAMLADTAHRDVPIYVVGHRCGFADQAHFSRRFRQAFGVSPTEFRTAISAGQITTD